MRAPAGTVAMRWLVCCGSQCLVVSLAYEDVNDAERLRHDPAMRWIVGGKAGAGQCGFDQPDGSLRNAVARGTCELLCRPTGLRFGSRLPHGRARRSASNLRSRNSRRPARPEPGRCQARVDQVIAEAKVAADKARRGRCASVVLAHRSAAARRLCRELGGCRRRRTSRRHMERPRAHAPRDLRSVSRVWVEAFFFGLVAVILRAQFWQAARLVGSTAARDRAQGPLRGRLPPRQIVVGADQCTSKTVANCTQTRLEPSRQQGSYSKRTADIGRLCRLFATIGRTSPGWKRGAFDDHLP